MWESHSNGRKLLQRRPPHHQLVSSSSNKPDPPPYVLRAIVMRLLLKERRTWKQRLHDSTSLITAVSYIGIISQLFITTQPTCTVQLIEPQWLLMEGGVTMWIHHCNSPAPLPGPYLCFLAFRLHWPFSIDEQNRFCDNFGHQKNANRKFPLLISLPSIDWTP